MQLNSWLRSDNAIYNVSAKNLTRAGCTKDTRVTILKKICDWALDSSARSPSVYWLNGMAGTGKSTIAYTIAQGFDRNGNPNLPKILAATFFCSQQLEDTRHQIYIISTLSYQLARHCYPFRNALITASNFDSTKVLKDQMEDLLVNPWQISAHNRSKKLPNYLVIVDALDEVEEEGGSRFLEDLLRTINAGHLKGLKFLITSHPDPKVVELCKSFSSDVVCHLHQVNTADVEQDITKFLQTMLPKLNTDKDSTNVTKLAKHAGGLFIYAATAVRFISPSKFSVSEQHVHLNSLLQEWPKPVGGDETLLVDTLYQQIITSAFHTLGPQCHGRLQLLHTILCAEEPVSTFTLTELLGFESEDTAEKLVESLHAVLYVSEKDQCIYWYHASFQDFVFDTSRSRFMVPSQKTQLDMLDASCNPSSHNASLAQQCFSIMKQSLCFNICNLPSSFMLDSEIEHLNHLVKMRISKVLQYGCQHWAQHLTRAGNVNNNSLYTSFQYFLTEQFLFWVEVMNLIDSKRQCLLLLQAAQQWILKVYALSFNHLLLM